MPRRRQNPAERYRRARDVVNGILASHPFDFILAKRREYQSVRAEGSNVDEELKHYNNSTP